MKTFLSVILLVAGLVVQHTAVAAACQALFDGTSLSGWEVLGDADYNVDNGTIVGTAVASEANSFLRTTRTYTDFELTLEFQLPKDSFNSGVQFRSGTYDEPTTSQYHAFDNQVHEVTWPAGRVWGYQAEIDPSARAWTGEIHDEAARGWLDTFEKEPLAIPIKAGVWHTFKIRAVADHLQTWLDDYAVANLRDSARSEGFIALQVHGIRDAALVGKAVRWRALELCEL
ncbi:MAG: DUF1080 domain-containing protein [Pseudomonadota bacterium]